MYPLLAALSTVSAICQPIPGSDKLTTKGGVRWIFVGVGFGTEEMPVLASRLVCGIARPDAPVAVALEIAATNQPALDAFIASDGGQAAQDALLKAPLWLEFPQDGRSSKAMFAMLSRLREYKIAGLVSRVEAVGPEEDSSINSSRYQTALAARLNNMPAERLTIVIATAASAGKTGRADGRTFVPAAALMKPEVTTTVAMRHSGGTAWRCVVAPWTCVRSCGENDLYPDTSPRLRIVHDARWSYFADWVLDSGTRMHASAPVFTSTEPAVAEMQCDLILGG